MTRRFSPSPSSLRLASTSLPTLFVVFSFVFALMAAATASADAPADADPNIQYRQKLMEAVGSNMAAVADIMKYGLAMPGHVENHARQMHASSRLVATAFRKEVAEGPTDAKPKIWKDWAKFEQAITDFEKAAQGLADAAASGEGEAIGAAMKTLGKSCSSCHKPFRKPKEESYKNQ